MKKLWFFCLSAAIVLCLVLQLIFWNNSYSPSDEILQESTPKPNILTMSVPYESGKEQQEMQQLGEEFMLQNPDVEIRFHFYPYEEYWRSLYLDYSRQSVSDLILMNTSMIPAIRELDILCSMDSYLNSNELHSVFSNKLLDGVTVDGHLYGVPFSCYTYALYCNTNILNKYSCNVPESWEELYEVCTEISVEPAASFAIAAAPGEELTHQFLQFLYANNATIRNLKDSSGIETFQMFANLAQNRLISKDCVNWNQHDLTQKFISQEVSMMVNNSAQLPALLDKNLDFDWIAVPIPNDGLAQSLFSEQCVSITKEADWQLAIRFLNFITSKQAVSRRAEQLGSLPVRSDVDSEFFSATNSYPVFLEQFTLAQPLPSHTLWQNISSSFQDAVIKTLQLEQTPEQIAQDTYYLVNKYIIDGQ